METKLIKGYYIKTEPILDSIIENNIVYAVKLVKEQTDAELITCRQIVDILACSTLAFQSQSKSEQLKISKNNNRIIVTYTLNGVSKNINPKDKEWQAAKKISPNNDLLLEYENIFSQQQGNVFLKPKSYLPKQLIWAIVVVVLFFLLWFMFDFF